MGGQRAVQVQDDPHVNDDNPTLYLTRVADARVVARLVADDR
jgi:hypothetical protein